MSPRQISREYRNQKQKAFIGFGIYYSNPKNVIDCLNIDLVSDFLSQKGSDVVHAFRYLNLNFIKY